MRTTDGKLAILDFGLMTEVTDNQKYGMVEAIAHLINRDYSEIGQDFINALELEDIDGMPGTQTQENFGGETIGVGTYSHAFRCAGLLFAFVPIGMNSK